MKKKLSVMSGTEKDGCVEFPALTQERAAEIAGDLALMSEGDVDILLLVAEVAMGLAPARAKDVTGNLARQDAAYVFVSRIFTSTIAFDECVRAFMRRLADPERPMLFADVNEYVREGGDSQ